MKQAFLTFIRKKENDIKFLAVKNPININDINYNELRSGLPVIVVISDEILEALYIIGTDGVLFQVFGENDSLFFMKKINDISLINIQKYNLIKFILLDAFDELTIQESKIYKNIFESFEEKIYYNTLHTELEFLGIKNFAIKELMKIELDAKIKARLLDKIKSVKPMPERFLKKKIDVDLTGYGIYINAFIGQSL